MVCATGSRKMTAFTRLLDAGSVLHIAADEANHQRLSVQCMGKELCNADEANLLDEEDMHIFGSRPMTDPLDLVCCNACKKPIKASQYASHAELCKTLCSRYEINQRLDVPAVNIKPQRKERRRLPISQRKKATLVREPKNIEFINYDDTVARERHIDEKIQMSTFTKVKRNMHLNSMYANDGSCVNPCMIGCSENVAKRSSKPRKRIAAECPPNPGTKNLCKTTAEALSYVPAPLATKMYYSQRNQNLRRAICHMFFSESKKEPSCDAPSLEALQVNVIPSHTSSPGNTFHDQVPNQQIDDRFLHLAQTPDQILLERSKTYADKSGALVPCMDAASQLPVNNSLGPHYISNSYPFADNSGSSVSSLQQGSGSVPVV